MSDTSPDRADPATSAADAVAGQPPTPRSRRSFLGVAAAALGAVAAQTVTSVLPAEAATGSTMKAGLANTATGTTTVKATGPGIAALRGWASNKTENPSSIGVLGQSDAPKGAGIKGVGSAANGIGVDASASGSNGTAMRATALTELGIGLVADAGGVGVSGTAHSALGVGVIGEAKGSAAHGVSGISANNHGIRGQSTASNKAGVYGIDQAANGVGVAGQGHNTSGYGVQGFGNTGVYGEGAAVGIQGSASASDGNGVSGVADTGPSAVGVLGTSASGIGVQGTSTAPFGIGVYGRLTTADGSAVLGWATGDRSEGVVGRSAKSTGVVGESSASGVAGVSGSNGNASLGVGVVGNGNTTNGYGVQGFGNVGVYGGGGIGVKGVGAPGVSGETSVNSGFGVAGWSNANGVGVYGWRNVSGYAGYFDGDTHVAGTLSKSAGSFVIDHPLDPQNRVLAHSFVESPEMLNVYSGTVVLGANGRATVRLPKYFEALNMEHRYQLTAIGGPAPELHVASEITDNRFVIAGGAAGQKVCWQVTGVRQDAYAKMHRIKVDTPKKAKDKGQYLNPDAFGKARTEGINYRKPPTFRRIKAKPSRAKGASTRRDP